jgi:Tfp pilus assembly protein PilF
MNPPFGRQATSLSLIRQAAGEAWQRRDFESYFELMRKALDQSSNDPVILLDLGTAYGLRTQFPEAVELFERAIDGARDKAKMLSMAALRCRDFLRYDLAAHYLGRAVQEPGASADTLATLGEIEERLRETVAAETAVQGALKIDPKCQLALLVQARLHRTAGHFDKAEKIVRSLVLRTDRSGVSTRIRGWYELAAILDRQGRYDEAVEALIAAKKMLLPGAAGSLAVRKSVHRELRQAASELSPGHFVKWNTLAPDSSGRRLALIAGHPRSGTTLLEQVLDAHSMVVSAEETEIFFETYYEMARGPSRPMVSLLDSVSAASVRNARENYFRRMDLFVSQPIGNRVLIDKNPALTGLIPGLLCVIPQVQIMVALRDPRDVCLSCFMQDLGLRYLTLDAAADEYCSMMGFWLAIKPLLPTPWLEVRYEDVVTDLQTQAERALRFLNLDWEPAVLGFNERARQKLIRSPTYAEVARPVSRGAVGRWRHYRKLLEPCLRKLAPLVEALGYEAD